MRRREQQRRTAQIDRPDKIVAFGEMADRVRAFDWAATPLGAIDAWPDRLAGAVEAMLAAPQMASLAIGPGRIFLYNDAASLHYGARHPALLGLPLPHAFPDEFADVAIFYDRVFAGESLHVPAQPLDPAQTGTPEVFDAYLSPVRGDRGEIIAVHMTGFAVGDRQINEAKLRESEARQAFLLKLSDVLRPLTSPVEVQKAAMKLLAERLDVMRATYFEVDADQDGFTLTARYERNPTPIPEHLRLSDFSPEMADAYRTGNTLIVRDTESEAPLEAQREAYRAIGVRAWTAVPLIKDGRLIAIVGVHSTSPRNWTNEEIYLLEDVAERTWAGVERARAETALLAGETRFRALATAGATSIYRMSADWRIMYQLDSIDFLAQTTEAIEDWADKYILLEDRAMVDAAIAQAITTKSMFHLEHRLMLADGSIGWVMSRAVPMLGPAGEVVEWFGAGTDITSRKRAEAALRESEDRQAFLLDLTDVMRSSGDADTIIAQASRMLGERLNASRIIFAEIDEDAGLAHLRREWRRDGVSAHPMTLQLTDFGGPLLADLRAGKVVRFDDVGEAPFARPDLAALAAIGIHAGMSVPLLNGGRLTMNLNVHQVFPRQWTDAELMLTQEVAERLWASLERARAEMALRDSEARYQALFASSPVPVMVLAANRPDFTITGANDAYLAATLTTRENLVGRRLFDVFTDDPDRPGQLGSEALDLSLQHVLTSRQADAMPRTRYDLVVPGGFEPHWWLAINAPLLDVNGEITAIIHQVTRVTELHLAEVAEREHQERQAFLLELSDVVRPLADPAEIKAAASRLLGEHLAVDRVAYAEFSEDETTVKTEGGYCAPGIASVDGSYRTEDFREFVATLRAGAVAAVRDTRGGASDRSPTFENMLAQLGIRAALAAPLIKRSKLVAALYVHSIAPRDWSDDELGLVAEVGDRTWAAVERAQMEAALRDSEERLQQFGEASQDILWLRDAATLQWVYLTPAFETVYGLSREEALSGDNYRSWQDLILPEDRDNAVTSIARVRDGEWVTFEFRVRRPSDGAIRWLRNTDFPITDNAGKVVLIGGIGHDFTEAREAEMRLQTLVEGMPQLVWRAVNGGDWTWASPQWTDHTGQHDPDFIGRGWLRVLHPDDHAAACEAWTHAMEDGGFEVEYRIMCHSDGRYRWFQTRAAPVRDHAGTIIEWLGTSTDIDELRVLQELQKTLLAELQHRVRNILAVTRSIISRSDDGERQTDDYVQHLQGRIAALARTQVLLTRRTGIGVDLEELIRDELLAQVASDDQFTLAGSDVQLSPKVAEVLTLAVHELATNATKYGAFSRADGRLDISWAVEQRDGQRWLSLDWAESGVPVIDAAPRRHGFGTELVSRRIPYELKGYGQFRLEPGGLHSRIEFPLVAGDSILQTDGVLQ